jgi:hypothetical protein
MKAYIVVGRTWDYDDCKVEWIVMGYLDKDKAVKHKENASNAARKHVNTNPYDKHMERYGAHELVLYDVVETEFDED